MQQSFIKTRKLPLQSYKGYHYLNSLSQEKITELLLFSEGDHFCSLLPFALNKKTLFLDDYCHQFLFKKILAREPKFFLNLVYGTKNVQNYGCGGGPGSFTLEADLNGLPLKKEYFDCVICPLVLQTDKISKLWIQNFSKILKNGGRLILSVRHPGLEKILFNQNPSLSSIPENSISQYFNWLKEHHLFTEEMSEGCVDSNLKPFFDMDGDTSHYQEYKNTPMILLFRAVKFER